MYRIAENNGDMAVHIERAVSLPTGVLTLSQILARVELRLRWYGLGDWRIRDAVCLGAVVTVTARGPHGDFLAFTVARDGGAITSAVAQMIPLLKPVAHSPAREAVGPGRARALGRIAIGALCSQWGPRGRFLTRPALCEG